MNNFSKPAQKQKTHKIVREQLSLNLNAPVLPLSANNNEPITLQNDWLNQLLEIKPNKHIVASLQSNTKKIIIKWWEN